jgi:hypothetical protein
MIWLVLLNTVLQVILFCMFWHLRKQIFDNSGLGFVGFGKEVKSVMVQMKAAAGDGGSGSGPVPLEEKYQ